MKNSATNPEPRRAMLMMRTLKHSIQTRKVSICARQPAFPSLDSNSLKKLNIGLSGKKRAQERPLHQVERELRARFRLGIQRPWMATIVRIDFFHRSRGGSRRLRGDPPSFCARGYCTVRLKSPSLWATLVLGSLSYDTYSTKELFSSYGSCVLPRASRSGSAKGADVRRQPCGFRSFSLSGRISKGNGLRPGARNFWSESRRRQDLSA